MSRRPTVGAPAVSPPAVGADEVRSGALYGFLAYGLWGLFPFYFHWMAPAGAWEILANRILWSLGFCLLLLVIQRDFGWLRGVFGRPATLATVTVAAVVLSLNWIIYVAAVLAGNVAEAALGYFLNPLVTVALGVIVLHEKLRTLQWVAVGMGVVAAVYLTIAYGSPPWISLILAGSFATYGLMKNRIGTRLTAVQSLSSETIVLAPIAAVILVVLGGRGDLTFTDDAPWHPLLLAMSGVVTATPLLLFAAAARRVPLVTIGLLQFITPVMQLICGIILGETVSVARWVGFGIVWAALVLLSVDSVRSARSRARAADECADPAF